MADEAEELTPDVEPRSAPRKSPRKTTAKRKAAPRTPAMEPRVRVLLSAAGASWYAIDENCGGAFLAQVPELSKAIGLWSQQDPRLAAWLNSMTAASGPLGVAIALMPVAQAVAAHHVVPAIQRRREIAGQFEGEGLTAVPQPLLEPSE